MGDLRNKMMKQARDEAHRQYLAKHHPPKTETQLPRCLCGLTYQEVPIMWEGPREDRWAPVVFYCPAYLPEELRRP